MEIRGGRWFNLAASMSGCYCWCATPAAPCSLGATESGAPGNQTVMTQKYCAKTLSTTTIRPRYSSNNSRADSGEFVAVNLQSTQCHVNLSTLFFYLFRSYHQDYLKFMESKDSNSLIYLAATNSDHQSQSRSELSSSSSTFFWNLN